MDFLFAKNQYNFDIFNEIEEKDQDLSVLRLNGAHFSNFDFLVAIKWISKDEENPAQTSILVFHLISFSSLRRIDYPASWKSTGLPIANHVKVFGVFFSGHMTPRPSARMEKLPFITQRIGKGRIQSTLKLCMKLLLFSLILGFPTSFQGWWWRSSVKKTDYLLHGVDSRESRRMALRLTPSSGWLATASPHQGLA